MSGPQSWKELKSGITRRKEVIRKRNRLIDNLKGDLRKSNDLVKIQKEVIERLVDSLQFIKRYSTEKPFSELDKFRVEIGEIASEALAFKKEKLDE